jgi:hypothetical protein
MGMRPLEKLIGDWVIEMKPGGVVVARAHAVGEPIAGGDYVLIRSETELTDDAPQGWHDNAPTSSSMMLGADDRSGTYACLYADSRGVHRIYEMTLDERDWRMSGQAGPEFFQRFIGAFSDDGSRIDGRWERSVDGETWELDFEGTYTRR